MKCDKIKSAFVKRRSKFKYNGPSGKFSIAIDSVAPIDTHNDRQYYKCYLEAECLDKHLLNYIDDNLVAKDPIAALTYPLGISDTKWRAFRLAKLRNATDLFGEKRLEQAISDLICEAFEDGYSNAKFNL